MVIVLPELFQSFCDPVYVEDEYLTGKCSEGIEIVLFPDSDSVGKINRVLRIGIEAYIWKRILSSVITRIRLDEKQITGIQKIERKH